MKTFSIIMFVLFVTLATAVAHTQTVSVSQGKTTKAAMKASDELGIEREARQRAYYELEKSLRELREELTEEKNEMTGSFTTLESRIRELPKNMQIGKGDSDAERLNKIYAGLGYDSESIGRVEKILEKLAVTGSDRDVAYKLLNLLYGIGNFTHQIVNEYLGEAGLYKLRDNKNIIDINDMFNEFVILREEVIERIDDQIEVAVSQKNSKQRMLAELSKVTRSNAEVYKKVYGRPNSLFEMQKEFERLIK
ncbi:hypothetical protein [Borrelia sp. P9F1]|uniref:hypothetical protein n=1 Tax=Borrelia sp. P9F1 TaxID=3058374 RepID=UPI002649D943|nr:hypothetical protein [Borrelia sp. P9F1]WKC58714.1 hypothetical protein QYZ68_05785 [Borrelia sp. P9F1]